MSTAPPQPDADLVEADDEHALPGRRIIAGTMWIIALTLLAYLPALNAGFIWDDDQYILENRTLRTTEGLVQIWLEPTSIPQYYPLVHTTYWFEYQLWGTDPLGYHLVNAIFHAFAAMMLWLVLHRLKVPGAFLAALVFAVHPVHVESVAWVTERKNTLSGLMYLWSALILLPFFGIRREGLTHAGAPRRSEWNQAMLARYAVGMLLFILALLSKSVTASLPAAMLLLIYWKHGRIHWRDFAWLLPFFVVGVVAGLHTAWLEKTHVGADGADFDLSFIQRMLIASRAICFYAWSLVWPSELTFFYYRWHVDPRFWWQWLFPGGLLALLAALWFGRHRIGRGPIVAVCFFCGTLFPALGFVDVYPMKFSFVADHFQYHASIGVIALIVGSLAWLAQRCPPAGRAAMSGGAAGVIVLFILICMQQSRIYEDKETLYRDVIRKNDTAFIAYTNLGGVLLKKGDLLESQRKTEEARAARLEAKDIFMQGYLLRPDIKSIWNLGLAYAALEQEERAVELFGLSLRIEPVLDLRARAYARILSQIGRESEAMAIYEEVIAQDAPENAGAIFISHVDYAHLLLEADNHALRDPAKALKIATAADAMTRRPSPLALHALAKAQAANGDVSQARENLEKATQIIAGDLERFGHLQAQVLEDLRELESQTPTPETLPEK